MMLARRALIGTMLLALFSPAMAEERILADPAKERRARALMAQIRCVVCQSQSIAESDAEIAADMRRLIRERIEAGESDKQILDYLASRYGDFVLFRPPFKPSTLALWLGPFAVLALAIGGALLVMRRRAGLKQPVDLDQSERARVTQMLERGIGPGEGDPS